LNLVFTVGALLAGKKKQTNKEINKAGRKERKKERKKETRKKETHKEGLVSLLNLSITKCLQICKIQQSTLPINEARKGRFSALLLHDKFCTGTFFCLFQIILSVL
jgi:hypothetical protein